jgi:hypothetical protein
MSIMTTLITMKTSTLTTSCRLSNQRRGQWYGSSGMSNRRTCSQDRRNLQEAGISKMSLLIMNLNKSIHQRETQGWRANNWAWRAQLIRVKKLQVHRSSGTAFTCGRRQLRIKVSSSHPDLSCSRSILFLIFHQIFANAMMIEQLY